MRFQFCPRCAAPLKPSQIENQKIPVCTNTSCGFIFWQNSKPCASLVITDTGGHVLLCRRAIEPELGKLDLPGGFLKEGEHPYDGARREAQEELGVAIQVDRMLGFVMDTYGVGGDATLNIAIMGKIVSGVLKPDDDVASVDWYRPDTIRTEELAFSNNFHILQLFRNFVS